MNLDDAGFFGKITEVLCAIGEQTKVTFERATRLARDKIRWLAKPRIGADLERT
jgi:hypothetical protein